MKHIFKGLFAGVSCLIACFAMSGCDCLCVDCQDLFAFCGSCATCGIWTDGSCSCGDEKIECYNDCEDWTCSACSEHWQLCLNQCGVGDGSTVPDGTESYEAKLSQSICKIEPFHTLYKVTAEVRFELTEENAGYHNVYVVCSYGKATSNLYLGDVTSGKTYTVTPEFYVQAENDDLSGYSLTSHVIGESVN